MNTKLYNLPSFSANETSPRLLRVIVDSEFTRIDFGYQTSPKYVRGGWVTMNPEAYIIIKGNDKKLKMIKTENIPLGPVKHNFRSIKESLYFSLFFPPVPEGDITLDIIEEEPNTPDLFNYYNVKIKKKEGIPVLNKIHFL